MNNKVKTTRKTFLKWSGLAFVGGLLLAGKRSYSSGSSEQSDTIAPTQSPVDVSRIRPAQNTVVRESV